MSSARDTQRIVKAALFWDVPSLRSDNSPSAQQFLRAFSYYPIDLSKLGDEPDTLGLAAIGVYEELNGNADQANRHWAEISNQDDDWSQLLALCLQSWAPSTLEPTHLVKATQALVRLQDTDACLRIIAKLIFNALDHRWDEHVETLLGEAVKIGLGDSYIGNLIAIEAMNLLPPESIREHAIGSDLSQSLTPDSLSRYPWIQHLANEGSANLLSSMLTARARSPWTVHWSMGTAADSLQIADTQSTWAGALGLRRTLRKQLAAKLLLQARPTPTESSNGVAMWTLSGGSQLSTVLDYAERSFDDMSGDYLARILIRKGALGRRLAPASFEILRECWDLLSIDRAAKLLDDFYPVYSDHPVAQTQASLWALLSVRLKSIWDDKLDRLTESQAQGVLQGVTPFISARLSRRSSDRIFESGLRLLSHEGPLPSLVITCSLLAGDDSQRERVFEHVVNSTPTTIANVSDLAPHVVDEKTLSRIVPLLVGELRAYVHEAKMGRQRIGQSPVSPLVRAIRSLRDPESASVLREIAGDHQVPSNIRLQAIEALGALARKSLFSASAQEIMEEFPIAGASMSFLRTEPELIQAAKISLALDLQAHAVNQAHLQKLARSPDQRVRELILRASLGASTDSAQLSYESILAAGLFDPEENVVQGVLDAFDWTKAPSLTGYDTIIDRLSTLLSEGRRLTRIAVVATGLRGEESKGQGGLRDRGLSDRSWLVRDCARRTFEQVDDSLID